MPKPRTKLMEAPMAEPVKINGAREVVVNIKGMLLAYDSVEDEWYSFAYRATCQGQGCTNSVDTPMLKRPKPTSPDNARMIIALSGDGVQPRGCVAHPPHSWV